MAVRVDSGLAYEALLSLVVATTDVPAVRFTRGPALRRRYQKLPASFRRLVNEVDAGLGLSWADLVGVVADAEPPRGVPELVARIRAVGPLQLKLAMLGYHDRRYRQGIGDELFREAAGGSRRAIATFKVRATKARKGLRTGPLVELPPDEVAQRTIAILSELPPELYVADRRVPQVLSRAAAQAAGLSRTLPPEAAVTKLTKGIVAGPLKHVLLVPTVIHAPWTLILDHERTKVFCFPVAVAEPAGDEPDPELVSLYRALADATRLRLLKRLAGGRATFGQLSHDLGLARSTLHQHALILRTAGLIRLHLDSGLELNPDRPALDRELEDFLSTT